MEGGCLRTLVPLWRTKHLQLPSIDGRSTAPQQGFPRPGRCLVGSQVIALRLPTHAGAAVQGASMFFIMDMSVVIIDGTKVKGRGPRHFWRAFMRPSRRVRRRAPR